MGVFHIFQIVHTAPNRATHHTQATPYSGSPLKPKLYSLPSDFSQNTNSCKYLRRSSGHIVHIEDIGAIYD